jgi:hypothetical protein
LVLLDSPEGVVGVDGEVVVERRRQWSPEHKAALLAEVEAALGKLGYEVREGIATAWANAGRVVA